MPVYKIFCDESCHLENDGADIMVLGGIRCSAEKVIALNKHIKWLRHQHNYHTELKWTKLILKQMAFYKALIDLLFDDDDIWFKATVVQHKERLEHALYNEGSHNTFITEPYKRDSYEKLYREYIEGKKVELDQCEWF